MSVKAKYEAGVFMLVEKTDALTPDTIYIVCSEDELPEIRETFGWLKVAEKSFEFWSNDDDAVYDGHLQRARGGHRAARDCLEAIHARGGMRR